MKFKISMKKRIMTLGPLRISAECMENPIALIPFGTQMMSGNGITINQWRASAALDH